MSTLAQQKTHRKQPVGLFIWLLGHYTVSEYLYAPFSGIQTSILRTITSLLLTLNTASCGYPASCGHRGASCLPILLSSVLNPGSRTLNRVLQIGDVEGLGNGLNSEGVKQALQAETPREMRHC